MNLVSFFPPSFCMNVCMYVRRFFFVVCVFWARVFFSLYLFIFEQYDEKKIIISTQYVSGVRSVQLERNKNINEIETRFTWQVANIIRTTATASKNTQKMWHIWMIIKCALACKIHVTSWLCVLLYAVLCCCHFFGLVCLASFFASLCVCMCVCVCMRVFSLIIRY